MTQYNAHIDLIGFLIVFGFFVHTIACMLIIIAIKYCPRWLYPGWIALCISTILVFIRRAGWAYSMILYGSNRHFFLWEYMIYVVISFGWAMVGLQMILHGREHCDMSSSSTTTKTSSYSRESKNVDGNR